MKYLHKSADYLFLLYGVLIILFGLLVLSSAGVATGIDRFHDPYFFIKRQVLFGFVPGIFLFLLLTKIEYTVWKKWAVAVFVFVCALLLMVFIPGIGSMSGTAAHSWLAIGQFSFQPSEIAKLGIIIFLAAFLTLWKDRMGSFTNGFLVILGVGLIPVVLTALEPDIGTAAILFCLVFALLFLGNARAAHLSALLIAGLAAFALLIAIAPYRTARFMTFLHPELDPQGVGYHINQAYLALGSGGWFGLGLGHSRQKFQYLPEVHADSIFAIMAEELGFVITLGFLLLFCLFILRGLSIAKHAPDDFGRLLVSGIMAWFVIQTFFNIGAMVGLLPLTGLPLPFVSHGGTALFIAMAALGIVANVSKHEIE